MKVWDLAENANAVATLISGCYVDAGSNISFETSAYEVLPPAFLLLSSLPSSHVRIELDALDNLCIGRTLGALCHLCIGRSV